MTPERLRALAEAAEYHSVAGGMGFADASGRWVYDLDDPALLPLIAERLVERVKKRIDYGNSKLLTELAVGSAEERAEAAYAVLEERDD